MLQRSAAPSRIRTSGDLASVVSEALPGRHRFLSGWAGLALVRYGYSIARWSAEHLRLGSAVTVDTHLELQGKASQLNHTSIDGHWLRMFQQAPGTATDPWGRISKAREEG